MKTSTGLGLIIILTALTGCAGAPPGEPANAGSGSLIERRGFTPTLDGNWIGNGISYGAYRDDEGPQQGPTSKADILEDLQIIAERWNLIRLYGADDQAENILEVIAGSRLPLRVMQGIWLDAHKSAAENDAQVRRAIELANRFPEIVVAVNVGNEIFVDWSWHRLDDMDRVIEQIREVRTAIRQPVTVSDDYNFWNKPRARRLAAELDFICLHAYAFWNDKTLDAAISWTQDVYRDIQRRFPNHVIAYCETGWPTSRVYDDGSYEGRLVGKAGETEQKIFFEQYDAWVESDGVVSFYFSSFDEKWKGGFDGDNPMAKAEKHWGLYYSNRTPKAVLR